VKVAIIDPLGAHGGNHYFTDGMARGLQHAGVDTTVFTLFETGKTGQEPYRVILAFRGLYGRSSPLWRGLRFTLGLIRTVITARLAGIRVAHIHCFHGDIVEQLSAILIRAVGMKLVITLHDIESFGDKGAIGGQARVLRLTAAVVVLNTFCLEQYERITDNTRPPAFVIPQGHYVDNFSAVLTRAAAREHLGLPQNKIIFLFFGNSRLEKGLDLLLRAMRTFRDEENVMLLVAGKMKPEQEAFYREIIAVEGVDDRVRMDVGHVSDEIAPAYYMAADVVVVPYRKIYNSGVTLMAMSFGRAVLASDLRPLADVLGNGEYGLLFASGSAPDLSESLRQAADAHDRLDSLGAKAKVHVLAVHDWNVIGEQLVKVYHRAGTPTAS